MAAKKIIESRRRRGKGLASTDGRKRTRLSADMLVKAYREDTDRKQSLIKRAHAARDRLLIIVEALTRLAKDERLLAILEDEGLETIPSNLAVRLRSSNGLAG